MKCYECGIGTYRKEVGRLDMVDECVGPYTVTDVLHHRCDHCGELLLPPETAKALETARTEIREGIIRNRPLCEFLSASETASALGISRQALHKHRRIRRGFIYQTSFGGNTVYLKSSVMLFKETGDGRFPLVRSTEPGTAEYVSEKDAQEAAREYVRASETAMFLSRTWLGGMHYAQRKRGLYASK